MKKKFLALALAFCCTLGLSACGGTGSGSGASQAASGSGASSAVKYPSGNTLNLIIPVKAGGNMDILGRTAAKYLGDAMGVNVVVSNIAGNGGVVAATQYLGEKANTNTVIFLPANIFTVSPLYSKVKYSLDDFAPIAAYNSEKNGVFAMSGGLIKSFDDLKKWAPDKTLLFGSGGQGVANYLMQASLYHDLGLKAKTVPHNSASEGLVNVIAHTTNLTLSSLNLAEQYVKKGSLIPLFTYEKEDYTYANGTVVPSLYKLTGKDYDIPSLQFFAVRAGTDQKIVDYLHEKFQEAFSNPDFKKEFIKDGGDADKLKELSAMSGSDVKSMIDTNAKVAKSLYEKSAS
ncbi:tripartite tricarboxylate transporter substrate-binding protein [Caproicibacter sp.]|uniref:tripartite tricarboxylate transporter substrate-binding protein n=1 Tax=Caproicibacter sp. TaxID=2814884 RepID=UPI003989859A